MRRLLLLLGTALALALPAALLAADGTDGTMSVKRGRALIVFNKLQGTAIGRMASGKVRMESHCIFVSSRPRSFPSWPKPLSWSRRC